jgi:propanol-preferring alcohol dehydrogenase
MQVWQLVRPAPIDERPLEHTEVPDPEPGPGQIRIRVHVSGVCRTDLHLAEGELPLHRDHVIPGHEIVGVVDAIGPGAERFRIGDRVGAAWLGWTCGACRFCRRGQENLCTKAQFTGWDRDGGYAELTIADERFVYQLPDGLSDEQAAPLLCAGIIGYRALKVAQVPLGGRLGLFGFGGSAHLTAQVAMALGTEVYVWTRSRAARDLAARLGASWVGQPEDRPPERVDAGILFAPAGNLVLDCLANLNHGGTVVIAGIHLSDIPSLVYRDHLFGERSVRSVTANTRTDGEELLTVAPRLGVVATTTPYSLQEADVALRDLAHGQLVGAAVLRISDKGGR